MNLLVSYGNQLSVVSPEIDNDFRIGTILTRIKIGDVDILFTIQNNCLTGGLCVGYFARKCSMFLVLLFRCFGKESLQ